ncbi:hypothetical protein O7A70_30005 [Mesorhizobium sp. Cs1299R1N1]|uniref:hypothetical protein n=1 Tax=Mesorhizobium sp. Cs1299R1N1 TaxID=3015172 RepID=UPI00301CEB66
MNGFLNGKTIADLAQEHRLSTSRARQIIERADRLVGGGILTKTGLSEATPRSDFMVAYPYVWSLAEKHRLGALRRTIFSRSCNFFKELQRAGSLERLVDDMKQIRSALPQCANSHVSCA